MAARPGDSAAKSDRTAKSEVKSDRTLAAASGLGIVLVVAGHVAVGSPEREAAVAAADPAFAAWLRLMSWVTEFHMPLFFVLSGVAYARFTKPKHKPVGSVLRERAARLLIPYVAISTVAFPVKAALSRFALRPVEFTLGRYLETLVVPWQNTIIYFWFLPTLLLTFCLLLPVERRLNRFGDAALFAALAAGYALFPRDSNGEPLNWPGVLHYAVFVFAGIRAEDYGWFRPTGRWAWGLPVSFALFAAFSDDGRLAAVHAVLGAVGSIGAAALLRPAGLDRIGDRSYQIYLLSWFPQIAVKIAFGMLPGTDARLGVVASLMSGVCLPVAAAGFADRFGPWWLAPAYGRRASPPARRPAGEGAVDAKAEAAA